jgi:peroxiredoxin
VAAVGARENNTADCGLIAILVPLGWRITHRTHSRQHTTTRRNAVIAVTPTVFILRVEHTGMAGGSIRKLRAGDAAPPFELPGTDGQTYTLDSFDDDEALLVVFTCNHCPYAKAKFEALNAIARDYDDVSVVGINPNDPGEYEEDSFERMQELVAAGTIDYDAYLFDESQGVAKAYGAVCTPDPFLLGRDDGAFTLAYHGRLDDALSPDDEPSGEPGFEARQAVDSLLAGRGVDREFAPSRGCTIKWRAGNEPDYWDNL